MAAVKFHPQQRKFHYFSQTHLDSCDARCGEVFIRHGRTLVFRCLLCASNLDSFDNFLDHLFIQHYEDVKAEVIQIDDENKRSDNEIVFEESTNDNDVDGDYVIHDYHDDNDDADADADANDDNEDNDYDGVDKYNESLFKVEVYNKPNFEKIEEIFLEDATSLMSSKYVDTDGKFEEFDLEQIKNDIKTKEQHLCPLFPKKQTIKTKKMRKQPLGKVISFTCHECGKEFETNRKLKRHFLTHSDERNHKCKICGFAFKERPNLDAHMRRHTGIKTIGCDYCSKKFFTRSEAKNHQHIHTGDRPFICPTCGLGFTTTTRLKMHSKRHNSDPDYKCNYCEKAFYGRAELKDHILVHTKEKPFVCGVCGARFPRNKSLIRHAKLHEGFIK